jgi:hypothetical protein
MDTDRRKLLGGPHGLDDGQVSNLPEMNVRLVDNLRKANRGFSGPHMHLLQS